MMSPSSRTVIKSSRRMTSNVRSCSTPTSIPCSLRGPLSVGTTDIRSALTTPYRTGVRTITDLAAAV